MTLETAVLRQRRRGRPWLGGFLLSITILVLGWSALWLFARREARVVMDAWFVDEAARGRDWTCPERDITGFPLRLHIACARPSFAGTVSGEAMNAELGGADAEVSILQPNAVDIHLVGPLTIHRGADGSAAVDWTALEIDGRALGGGRVRFELLADDLSARDAIREVGTARHLEVRVNPAAGHGPEDRAYETSVAVFDAGIPALDALLGTRDPVSFEQKGVATRIGDDLLVERWPEMLERWRAAGGMLDLDQLLLDKGDLKVRARGELDLDAAHRPSGRLQAAVAGYEAVADRLGLPKQAVAMGGALAGLLGPKLPVAVGEPALPGAVTLPVVLKDGRVSVGPFRTGLRLDPLY